MRGYEFTECGTETVDVPDRLRLTSGSIHGEYVDVKILKWIRLVIARQPDAEFIFVATKTDMVERNRRFAKRARLDLKYRLEQYVAETTKELARVLNEERRTLTGGPRNRCAEVKTKGFSVQQLRTPQGTIQRLLQHEWARVSCVDATSIEAARAKIEELIVASNRSFPMPESYTIALECIREFQNSLAPDDSLPRVREAFRKVVDVIEHHRTNNPKLNRDTCREIVRILHDLGDVLWYEDLGIDRLKNEVILDPMLLIDFIRPVADHNFTSEVMPHSTLKTLPLWLHLDQDFMLAMKKLLQEFNLVHVPRQRMMEWDSDLIVPASWRSKSPASVRFGGQSLAFEFVDAANRLRSASSQADEPVISANVRWEYHFLSLLPESVFDQIVITSYSSLEDRTAGPDWILYEEIGVFACRAIICRHSITKERIIRLEAVAAGFPEQHERLWELFQRLCTALERVLRTFRGLVVTRQVLKDTGEFRKLEDVVADWLETRSVYRWLPPKLAWYDKLRKKLDSEQTSGN